MAQCIPHCERRRFRCLCTCLTTTPRLSRIPNLFPARFGFESTSLSPVRFGSKPCKAFPLRRVSPVALRISSRSPIKPQPQKWPDAQLTLPDAESSPTSGSSKLMGEKRTGTQTPSRGFGASPGCVWAEGVSEGFRVLATEAGTPRSQLVGGLRLSCKACRGNRPAPKFQWINHDQR